MSEMTNEDLVRNLMHAVENDHDSGADTYSESSKVAMAAVLARMTAGWRPIDTVSRKREDPIDLWVVQKIYDRAQDKMVNGHQWREPAAIWFDGRWCDIDGNPFESIDADCVVTHWCEPPAPPAAP